ncbi:uncharacterized protein [Epargyreus clarus]|uniref:uncharacterized protein n=1 Tax=Epargyreus clarus TaxID=520877 RepID=UPI003C2DAFCD
MPSCVIPTCRRASGLGTKKPITFHKIPRDEIRKEIWIKIIQSTRIDESWKPTPATVICSEHFSKEYTYNTPKGFTRLRPEAVPSNNIVCGLGYPILINETHAKIVKPKDVLTEPSSTTSKSSNDEMDAQSCDNSKIDQLKSDLRRITHYTKKYKSEIKFLQTRIARLSKQNQLYENAINSLENNQFEDDDIYKWISEKIVTVKDLNSINIKFTRKTFFVDNITKDDSE